MRADKIALEHLHHFPNYTIIVCHLRSFLLSFHLCDSNFPAIAIFKQIPGYFSVR